MTFKPELYGEYEEVKNKNIFEEIIDHLMMGEIGKKFGADVVDEIRKATLNEKRSLILSLIDKDFSVFGEIYKKIGNSQSYPKMEHVNEIMELMRKYVSISAAQRKEVGEVMTPVHLIEEMLDKLPDEVWSDPEKTFFDPCNGTGPFLVCIIKRLMKGLESWEPDEEARYKHIVEKQIFTCELGEKNMFLYLCTVDPQDKYILNVYCGDFLHGGFDNHAEKIWNMKKFDIIVANPPYSKNLHLKFLDKCVDMANEDVVFVHPSSQYVEGKGVAKVYTNIINKISPHMEGLELFNGNGVFNISLFVPCAITHLKIGKKSKKFRLINRMHKQDQMLDYSTLADLSMWGYREEMISFKNKISEALIDTKSLQQFGTVLGSQQEEKRILHNSEAYFIEMTHIRGHVEKKLVDSQIKEDFFTIISKKEHPKRNRNPKFNIWFEFKTEQEANNFLSYIKTDFVRMCLALVKTNQNLARGELKWIPVVDFTRNWTDAELYEHFNITEEEQAFIKEIIPPYYD